MNLKQQPVLALLCIAIATVCTSTAQAQRIRIQEGPYYVGEPVTLQVVVRSDGNDISVKHIGKDSELTLRGPRVQSTSSGTTIVNGQVIQSETQYVYQYSIVSQTPGLKTVGPFEISVGYKKTTTDTVEFNFEILEDSPDMFLNVTTDTTRAYVGQTIPVTVQWGYSASGAKVSHAFRRLRISSKLFDEFELQLGDAQAEYALVLQVGDSAAEVDAKITEKRIDGKKFVVATAGFGARCSTSGKFEITSRCRSEELLARGFFGGSQGKPIVATGAPFTIEVLPVPTGGPPTFSGAVGDEYTIATRLKRTQARVGDPIQLTVTLRGKPDFSSLRLPDWSTSDAAELFQFPSEQPTGQPTGDGKRFELTIRAKEAGISSLPPLEFTWFDPVTESFQTAKSKPLPLEIAASELVTSSSVYSAAGPQSSQAKQSSSGAQDLGSTLAANLAINRDTAALTRTISSLPEATIKTLYASAIGLVAFALLWRSRTVLSPSTSRQTTSSRKLSAQLASARTQPPAEAAKLVASALRQFVQSEPSMDDATRHEIDSLLSDCDAIAFSPTPTSDTSKLASLAERAQQIVSAAK
ncbi:MAG: hypothetical protein Aurels2KO_43940 [Aureliella sp.]